ncbi:MAG: hypothetical protein BWZ07_00508 [Alphaproteobacteria bacterium ADurb.BinA280]|nr:MAG: hypothetical protein BWZ07_00508 [Alphaproteobacteria bacterium ADurb.BinA280]
MWRRSTKGDHVDHDKRDDAAIHALHESFRALPYSAYRSNSQRATR